MERLFFKKLNHKSVEHTYSKELNKQAKMIAIFASLISLTWLLYIPIDIKLNSNPNIIILLRIGLSFAGLLALLFIFLKKIEYNNLIGLSIYGFYLVFATAIITGLSGGNPAYIGGYLFILMLLAVAPLPIAYSWFLLFSSYLVFIIILFSQKQVFSDTLSYSFRDSINVIIVDAVLIFLNTKMRYSNWKKSIVINKEKEKNYELLLNILPNEIADELQKNGCVKPVFHKSATVVFTDFVGFTWITEILDPETLINKLDRMFKNFDQIIDKYKLEKLKTIGDSYMYVGGIPNDNTTHAIDSVLAAMEIISFVNQENAQTKDPMMLPWEIRIGINTGEMMAGVVGQKKFIYDVWGDSVNTASRLETFGVKGRLNISSSTYELIKDFFDVEDRGMIPVKNKGEINMHLIVGIKKELSKNGLGLEPNEKFCNMYCKIKNSKK